MIMMKAEMNGGIGMIVQDGGRGRFIEARGRKGVGGIREVGIGTHCAMPMVVRAQIGTRGIGWFGGRSRNGP